jgi:anthranilate synthase component 1
MTELEFQSLANEGFNRIPLIAEALADLETPLSLYLKLAQRRELVPAGIGGGRRALRALFVHRPAGAHDGPRGQRRV